MSNINDSELKVLRRLGEILISRSDIEINISIKISQLYEVKYEKERK